MFKIYIPIEWISPLVYDDFSSFSDEEESTINGFVEDLRDGKCIDFYCPTDEDVENSEFRLFNGKLTDCIKIGYDLK